MASEPNACTASVWNRDSGLARLTASEMAATSWMVPVSLLTIITDTTAVSSVTTSAISPGSTRASESTPTMVTGMPSRFRKSAVSNTASCSMAVVTRP
jgi:hypothetical protein